MLLTLQSLCPEPSQAPGCGRGREGAVWRAWRPPCMHSFGEEENRDLEEAFPWDDIRSLRRGLEAPVCKGHVLTGKGICSGIGTGPVFHLSSGPGKGLGKKKKKQKWVGEGQYLNSVVIFLLEEGNFLGKREFFFCTVGSGQELFGAGSPAVASHSPIPGSRPIPSCWLVPWSRPLVPSRHPILRSRPAVLSRDPVPLSRPAVLARPSVPSRRPIPRSCPAVRSHPACAAEGRALSPLPIG